MKTETGSNVDTAIKLLQEQLSLLNDIKSGEIEVEWSSNETAVYAFEDERNTAITHNVAIHFGDLEYFSISKTNNREGGSLWKST
jgi:hypothetical protein